MKRKYSASRVEWEYIGRLINAINDQNIKDQVSNALEWYVIKATRYRMIEYILNGVTLVVPAILLLLNKYVENDCMAGQLITAASGTFAASAKAFSKLHDKRICYRRAAEEIKNEAVLYIHQTGVYKVENRNAIFAERINAIRKSENSSWVEIENDKAENSN